MKFGVSVIIPVYNAEKFLANAVQSALQFECVSEIILIEDASPDDALALCHKLASEDSRIKVFCHPNNENRGAGASRNLGIEKATSEYISFLDADDWYEKNRFDAEIEIFSNSKIDGVYGASGCFSEYENSYTNELVTISENVSPYNLLYELIRPNGGRFNTNAITIRKDLFEKTGNFNVALRLHQDSELWLRFAFFGNIVGGTVDKPIAYYRRHEKNRITSKNKESTLQYCELTFNFFIKQSNVDKRFMRYLFKILIINKSKNNSVLIRLFSLLLITIRNPSIIIKIA